MTITDGNIVRVMSSQLLVRGTSGAVLSRRQRNVQSSSMPCLPMVCNYIVETVHVFGTVMTVNIKLVQSKLGGK